MTPEALAALHADCFTAPRPWSVAEFQAFLNNPNVHLIHKAESFALIQQAGPEVELLTIAVPAHKRRRGIGKSLLNDIIARALHLQAEEVILEVAENNLPALTLYLNAGFIEAGLRKNYYEGPTGTRVTAKIMRKTLG